MLSNIDVRQHKPIIYFVKRIQTLNVFFFKSFFWFIVVRMDVRIFIFNKINDRYLQLVYNLIKLSMHFFFSFYRIYMWIYIFPSWFDDDGDNVFSKIDLSIFLSLDYCCATSARVWISSIVYLIMVISKVYLW